MSTFQYPGPPLQNDEIRLIRLLPGKWSDLVHCKLLHSSLGAEGTDFHALSYVWGSLKAMRSILLDGRPFATTVNLESALQHLRLHYDEGLVLWVDALCINQMDLDERTHQVQMMGQIYGSCRSTIVYLGDGVYSGSGKLPPRPITHFFNDDRDLRHIERFIEGDLAWDAQHEATSPDFGTVDAFSLIRVIAQDKHFSSFGSLLDNWTSQNLHSENQRLHLFEALRRLMNPPWTPWWKRIWVVQEATLPKDLVVICGSVLAPWRMLAKAGLNFTRHSGSCCSAFVESLPRDQSRVLIDFSNRVRDLAELRTATSVRSQNVVEGPPEDLSLLRMLQRFRDRKASDPRDKVYALLSLVEAGGRAGKLVPDYSVAEKEVFRRATIETMYASNSLSVLSTDIGRKFRNDLPSWVPDWGAGDSQTNNIRAKAISLYNAPSSNQCCKHISPDDETFLQVNADRVDSVSQLEDVMWGDSASLCQDTIYKWGLAVDRRTREMNPGEREWQMENFWRILCADVICTESVDRSQSEVRRTTVNDQISFLFWALESMRSPFRQLPRDDTELKDMRHRRHGNLDTEHVEEPEASVRTTLWLDKFLSPTTRPWSLLLDLEKDLRPMGWTLSAILQSTGKASQALASLYPHYGYRAKMVDTLLSEALELKKRMIDDHTGEIQRDAPWKEFLENLRDTIFGASDGSFVDPNIDRGSREELVASMDSSIMAATLSRRLFMTPSGHIGLASADTEIGDEVYYIDGGMTPFILRRWRTGLDIHELVGHCYLQGMMDMDYPHRYWKDIRLK